MPGSGGTRIATHREAPAAGIGHTGRVESGQVPGPAQQLASDADREAAVSRLAEAASAGVLTPDELDERVERALSARRLGDLARLLADLPPEPGAGRAGRRGRPWWRQAGFDYDASAYVLTNAMLVAIWAATGHGPFWPLYPIGGWAIGLGAHGVAATRVAARRTRGATRHRAPGDSAVTRGGAAGLAQGAGSPVPDRSGSGAGASSGAAAGGAPSDRGRGRRRQPGLALDLRLPGLSGEVRLPGVGGDAPRPGVGDDAPRPGLAVGLRLPGLSGEVRLPGLGSARRPAGRATTHHAGSPGSRQPADAGDRSDGGDPSGGAGRLDGGGRFDGGDPSDGAGRHGGGGGRSNGGDRSAGGDRAGAGTRAGGDVGPGKPTGQGRTRYVAVLFADIVGSTPLNEALGDDAWNAVRVRTIAAMRACVHEHGGVDVSTQGDGLLARFDAPADAVRAAVAMQRQAGQPPAADSDPGPAGTSAAGGTGEVPGPAIAPSLHIGAHAGPVIEDGTDLVGNMVNVAARVTALAGPGQILVTEALADLVGGDVAFDDLGMHALKGVSRPRHLLAVRW